MSRWLVVSAVLWGSSANASGLSDAPERFRGALAQVGEAASGAGPLLRELERLKEERPSDGRIFTGKILTGVGGALLALSGAAIAIGVGTRATIGLLVLSLAVPGLLLGVASLITGLVMWLGGVSGQARVDARVEQLEGELQRWQIEAPPPMPSVLRGARMPQLVVARF